MSSIVSRLYQVPPSSRPLSLELQELIDLQRRPSTNCRHTFLTHGATSLDISGRPARTTPHAWLRSRKAMDTRTARVNHHRGAKDQLCVPQMFSFGHLRQLDAVMAEALRRAWSFLSLPARLVFDLDSTICEVAGKHKSGAAYGYTKVLGYHPILATRSDTGEVVHARMRKGSANTCRGAKRFVEELVARARRAGATGKIVLRMDSGFWSKEILASLCRLGVSFTMAVRTANVAISRAIEEIDEDAWVTIEYPEDGEAQVAETSYKGFRLVVRRTRLVGPQATLWPNWRHFAFLTDLDGTATELDAFHRNHAVIELDIRDLKEGSGLCHLPSGNFWANGAWLACAVLAHNLLRWTQMLGELELEDHRPVVARTMRTRIISVPGRLVNRSGMMTLRAPSRWPWQKSFQVALQKIRAIPLAVT